MQFVVAIFAQRSTTFLWRMMGGVHHKKFTTKCCLTKCCLLARRGAHFCGERHPPFTTKSLPLVQMREQFSPQVGGERADRFCGERRPPFTTNAQETRHHHKTPWSKYARRFVVMHFFVGVCGERWAPFTTKPVSTLPPDLW